MLRNTATALYLMGLSDLAMAENDGFGKILTNPHKMEATTDGDRFGKFRVPPRMMQESYSDEYLTHEICSRAVDRLLHEKVNIN